MSGVVDVGDAIELTFNTVTGADVTATWLDPDLNAVVDAAAVAEVPSGSGKFPYTFLPTLPGVWTARYTASGAATQVESYYVRASAITGPPPLAAVGDVSAQYGALTPAQEGITSWLLRAASKMVRFRFPRTDEWLAAGRLDRDVVALVVANMVLRVLRNPGGLRAETVGPFSRTYDTGNAAGLLTITEEELGLLVPAVVGTSAYAIGTIRLKPGLAPPPRGWHRDWRW